MSTNDSRRLFEWFIEQMRTPPDPEAELEHERFENERGALIRVWHIRNGRKPATARTRAEMEFAASLEPCPSCGAHGLSLSLVTLKGSGSSWTLSGTCPSCGKERDFAFQIEGDPTTATHGPAELSRMPSFLIPDEKFQAELERLLPLAQTDPQARHRALICMNELVKLTDVYERDRRRAELCALVDKG